MDPVVAETVPHTNGTTEDHEKKNSDRRDVADDQPVIKKSKTDGRSIYVTCTVEKTENSEDDTNDDDKEDSEENEDELENGDNEKEDDEDKDKEDEDDEKSDEKGLYNLFDRPDSDSTEDVVKETSESDAIKEKLVDEEHEPVNELQEEA